MLGWKGISLTWHEPEAGKSLGEQLERDRRLELPEGRADAEVDALAEREGPLGVLPLRIEALGSGKTDGSRPVAASQRNSFAPAGNRDPGDA